jgi:hypothetical protein
VAGSQISAARTALAFCQPMVEPPVTTTCPPGSTLALAQWRRLAIGAVSVSTGARAVDVDDGGLLAGQVGVVVGDAVAAHLQDAAGSYITAVLVKPTLGVVALRSCGVLKVPTWLMLPLRLLASGCSRNIRLEVMPNTEPSGATQARG